MAHEDLPFPPAAPPAAARAPESPPDLPPVTASAPSRALAPVRPGTTWGARAKAGLGVVAAAIGAGAGCAAAGPLGGLAGLATVGTIRNLYRSQGIGSSDPAERGDAARSLALGLIGVAIVGVLGYKLYSSSKDNDE